MNDKDLEISLDENAMQAQHRRAFRAAPPSSVLVRMLDTGTEHRIKDISFLGIAFIVENCNNFQIGQKIKIDVLLRDYVFLKELRAEVVRILPNESVIACTFPELTSSDEVRLTKLVLEIQKEYIRRNKRE